MKRIVIFASLAVILFAVGAAAAQTRIFDTYENVRQALLKGSLADAQTSSRALAAAARAENQTRIAERANALTATANLKAARDSFAVLSDEVIKFRDAQAGDRPVVLYCSMHKASWLQPAGATTNPYVEDKSMIACGEVRKDSAAPAASPHQH